MTNTAVHLAVYDTLADWEVGYATAHIATPAWQREPGRYKIVTVGETGAPVTTMGGVRIVPDLSIDQLAPADSALLILPGAETWLNGGNGPFVAAARAFLDAGVPVAAICGATIGPAAAGLLDDRRHTSNHPAPLQAMGYGGAARYVDEPAVRDGDLITASATAPVEFAREIFGALDLYDPAVLDAWYKLFGRRDPAGYEELMAAAGVAAS